MLNGINHITIAVADLDISFAFYVDILGMTAHAKWHTGAYLSLNNIWFCLSLDDVTPAKDYCHLAFDINEQEFKAAILSGP